MPGERAEPGTAGHKDLAADEREELAAALPGYEIGEVLGRGACGLVVAGRHCRLGRDVAVKRLSAAFAPESDVSARFLAEAQLLASLDHPHLVRIYDFVEVGGLRLLIMERLNGGTVKERLVLGRTDARAACAVLVAACAGLEYAHQQGVLHRDVKPQNLLLSAAGVVKVGDFGIAKVLADPSSGMTQTGAVLGTPAYMAPEQVSGGPVSAAIDVYAAGTVLYELLSGALPFPPAPDAVAQLFQRVLRDPIPLRERAADVPPALAAITERALRRNPSERFESAGALGEEVALAAAREWGAAWMVGTGLVLGVAPPEVSDAAARARRATAASIPTPATDGRSAAAEGPIRLGASLPAGPRPITGSEVKAELEAERLGQPFVVFRDEHGRQQIVGLDLNKTQIWIGRKASTDIPLAWDPEVSGLHAHLQRRGDEWTLVDDGTSRNGSYVNGERLHGRRHLRDRDMPRFGRTVMLYRCPAEGVLGNPTVLTTDELVTADSLSVDERRILISLCRPFKDNAMFAMPPTDAEIAAELGLSIESTEMHMCTLLERFLVDDLPVSRKRLDLVKRALASGLITDRDL